jgi:hypothetical protein
VGAVMDIPFTKVNKIRQFPAVTFNHEYHVGFSGASAFCLFFFIKDNKLR